MRPLNSKGACTLVEVSGGLDTRALLRELTNKTDLNLIYEFQYTLKLYCDEKYINFLIFVSAISNTVFL